MIPLVKPYIAPTEVMMPAIEKVLYSGYIAEGETVRQFENDFGILINNDKVVAVNSGTAALHLALSILDIGEGDEVISTPMTAEPTNIAIALTKASIVWADVHPATGLMDPESAREKITPRTKAIVLVHYAGMVCDMDRFTAISKETGVPIIEDAAHCLGGEYAGRMIGAVSRFTCFSFQAIKHMTTIDGGVLSVKYDDDEMEARKLRWFGLDKKVPRLENNITKVGFKYAMNNVNAVIGIIQMRYINSVIERCVLNGRYFDRELSDIAGVTLVPYHSNTKPAYWLYTIKVDERETFCKAMRERGIEASILHQRNDIHDVFAHSRCSLPGMDEWYSHFVHIPCGWWVGKEERDIIVSAIRKGW